MTVRQQIMTSIGDLLDGVASLTGGAYSWRFSSIDPGNLPAAVYRDGEGSAERIAGGVLRHTLPIDVEFFAKGDTADQVIRVIAKDILATIGVDPTLGGLLEGSSLTEFEMAGDQADATLIAGRLALSLNYETPLWQI